jgi:hypothetical protein
MVHTGIVFDYIWCIHMSLEKLKNALDVLLQSHYVTLKIWELFSWPCLRARSG